MGTIFKVFGTKGLMTRCLSTVQGLSTTGVTRAAPQELHLSTSAWNTVHLIEVSSCGQWGQNDSKSSWRSQHLTSINPTKNTHTHTVCPSVHLYPSPGLQWSSFTLSLIQTYSALGFTASCWGSTHTTRSQQVWLLSPLQHHRGVWIWMEVGWFVGER